MITAEVTGEGLKDIRVSPLPGHGTIPTFPIGKCGHSQERHLVERMLEAGKLLK
jgi:hypothetical protein